MAFVGCQKEEINNVGADNGKREISLVTSADAFGPRSRMNYVDGEGLSWENTDNTSLGVISNWANNSSSNTVIINDDGTATFKSVIRADATHILTYYPWNGNGVVVSGDNYTITLPVQAEQTQNVAGTMGSGYVTLVGTTPMEVAYEENEAGEIVSGSALVQDNKMLLTNSVLRFRVYDSVGTYAAESVKSISVTVDGAVLNADVVSTGNIKDTATAPVVSYTNGTATSAVTLNTAMELSGKTSAATTSGIYLAVTPYTAKATYVVTTERATYTFATAAEKTVEAGNIYDIALNLSSEGAVREGEDPVQPGPDEPDSRHYIPVVLDAQTYASIESEVLVDARENGGTINLYTWEGTAARAECEGPNSNGVTANWVACVVSEHASSVNWFGFGMNVNDSDVITAYNGIDASKYYIHIASKSVDTGTSFSFKLYDSNGEYGATIGDEGVADCDFTFLHDGEWHEIDIPLTFFTDKGMDFASVTNGINIFGVSQSPAGVWPTRVDLDAVYFYIPAAE